MRKSIVKLMRKMFSKLKVDINLENYNFKMDKMKIIKKETEFSI